MVGRAWEEGVGRGLPGTWPTAKPLLSTANHHWVASHCGTECHYGIVHSGYTA